MMPKLGLRLGLRLRLWLRLRLGLKLRLGQRLRLRLRYRRSLSPRLTLEPTPDPQGITETAKLRLGTVIMVPIWQGLHPSPQPVHVRLTTSRP